MHQGHVERDSSAHIPYSHTCPQEIKNVITVSTILRRGTHVFTKHLHSVKIAKDWPRGEFIKSHIIIMKYYRIHMYKKKFIRTDYTTQTHLPPEWVQMCTVPMEASSKVWSPSLHL